MEPEGLKYTKEHEWVRLEDDGTASVGITSHAQEELGDITFIELPSPGKKTNKGASIATVESVKAASDIYAPVSGEITAVNAGLADSPETINSDPYGAGWICRVKLDDAGELDLLMDAESYTQYLGSL